MQLFWRSWHVGFDPTICERNQILGFHVQFECIHPFDDYNGRVGRIIMMKECLRHEIVPFIIDDKRRGEYNRGIAQWDYGPRDLTKSRLRGTETLSEQTRRVSTNAIPQTSN